MRRNNKYNNPDQLDVFTDRTFESVDNNTLALRTPEEILQKEILRLLCNLGLGPDFIQCDFENKYFVVDNFIVRLKVEARLYLLYIVAACRKSNSLIYISTSLGKTYIELLTAHHYIKYKDPRKKVLILAPTKPLCLQHKAKADEIFVGIKTAVLTGNTTQKKRRKIWDENQIIIATPQTITRELKKENGIGRSEDLQLVLFDEIHNMVGLYDYVTLAEIYTKDKSIRLAGFTASLDSDPKKLQELMLHMGLKYSDIIAKTENSPDVAPYVYKKSIHVVKIKRLSSTLQDYLRSIIYKEFIKIIAELKIRLSRIKTEKYGLLVLLEKSLYRNNLGDIVGISIKNFNELIYALSEIRKESKDNINCSLAMRDWGLIVLFHTSIIMLDKGLHELRAFLERKYFEKINKKPSQYAFRANSIIKECVRRLCFVHLWTVEMEYPAKFNPQSSMYNWFAVFQDAKLKKLESAIRMNLASQILIFVQYRDTLDKIIKYLQTVFKDKKIDQFIGQSNKLNGHGMTQKRQADILRKFTCGEIDILVATSIGEQGLNFPAVDVVFFYEPITDPRRIIQRCGRTGRYRDGDIFILTYCGENEQEEFISNIAFAKLHKANELMKFYEEHGDCF